MKNQSEPSYQAAGAVIILAVEFPSLLVFEDDSTSAL